MLKLSKKQLGELDKEHPGIKEIFRQAAESEIVTNAYAINQGRMPNLKAPDEGLSDFYFIEAEEPEAIQDLIVRLVKERIAETSEDRTRVLAWFGATSMSGESFGGTCLYIQRNGQWAAYTIKPSESQTIAQAEAWLVKRKWRAW
jgi:hypothetical protein